MSTPFFNVTRSPLFTNYDNRQIRSNNDALINTESGQIVGEVSKHYKIVTNSEISEIFSEAFEDVPVYSINDHLNVDGSKWKRDIILDGDNYTWLINNNDECKMKVSIVNSYDGKSSVGFNISGWRQVCSNGMFGWSSILSVKLSHIKEGVINTIRNEFTKKVDIFSEKSKIFKEWAKIEFTKKDYDDFIESRNYLSDKMKEKYKGYYEPIMNKYSENRETKWEAYNVLTAVAEHYTKARKGSHVFSFSYKRTEKMALELGEWTPIREKKIAISMS